MFFKKELRDKILAGEKWETRRQWSRPMTKVGGIYQVRISRHKKGYHFLILVLAMRKSKLGAMTSDDAIAEGFSSLDKFKECWKKVNGTFDPDEEVTVIRFRVCSETEKMERQ